MANLVSISCSVVGLNFDFLVLNLTKHSSYLIYNAALFFSPFIQQQYHDKYGDKEVCLTVFRYECLYLNSDFQSSYSYWKLVITCFFAVLVSRR